MARTPFTWNSANFTWNDNPYTWDDVEKTINKTNIQNSR